MVAHSLIIKISLLYSNKYLQSNLLYFQLFLENIRKRLNNVRASFSPGFEI